MQVKISQAQRMITLVIKAKKVAMLHGSPAIGKSGIVHAIGKEYGLKVIDMRLAQCDPTDLCGFPMVNGKKASYVPMDTFPIEGDEIPKGYNGWLLFLDEFTSASKAVQAAAYKVVLDRMVGLHHLHEKVAIVCAGNMATDGAIVEEMSTALQSRLIHMELVVDDKEWCNWATDNGVDYRITSYIQFKPSALYTFSPDHTDHTYASPRTWKFADDLMKVADITNPDMTPLLAGTLSEGVAREFIGFCKIFKDLPSITQIVDAPDSIRVPDEPSINFALCGSIANHSTMENVSQLMKFVKRLAIEFQVVCLREMVKRNKAIIGSPAVQSWVSNSATTLF